MEGKAIAYNYQYITDGSTLAVIPLSQRLHKCLQTNGFDVIGLISADVGNMCKVYFKSYAGFLLAYHL